ncbi:hypothetical protein GDO78_014393 [Eleutherodactylus coqui]|uniref:G-protein coupled receptors family 1 profile domain-containing protein n=1 Tax=Eleutherodactylus coqui TaxID=57060 RepID=A0A8J6ELJ0_ELECQ|nr:hypothetical protein GDO78_014393 [Eleutherodactylus coqui]
MENKTFGTELILLGFSNYRTTNMCLFPIFFLIYMLSVVGNCLIICVIILNSPLHTPMYFFLINLSFIDLCYSSSAIPKLLIDLLVTHRTISVLGCLMQFKVILLIGAAFVWIFSFINVIIPSLAMPIIICYPNEINNFMCEVLSVLKLSCDDTSAQELVIFYMGFIVLLLPFVLILVSYICIISSVLKIHSAERSKAFSTCTSHITVVVMFFGSQMLTYFRSLTTESLNQDKYFLAFCTMISPILNPLIYSLNNREVKKILRKKRECMTG